MNGASGDDTVLGGDSDDRLTGSLGSDVLDGGFGDDSLLGGTRADELTGGDGNDVFRYAALSHGTAVASNITLAASGLAADVVTDFVTSVDVFNFLASAFDPNFDINNTGNPPVLGDGFSIINGSYNGTNAGTNDNFGDAVPAFVFSLADRTLYYDANGVGAGYTAVATVESGTMTADDIIMVAA